MITEADQEQLQILLEDGRFDEVRSQLIPLQSAGGAIGLNRSSLTLAEETGLILRGLAKTG